MLSGVPECAAVGNPDEKSGEMVRLCVVRSATRSGRHDHRAALFEGSEVGRA